MTISGFSFLRNADKLYYPVAASIRSILPIVDEFVIALGKGDEDDKTLEEILSIGDDKIRIIHTEWNTALYTGGTEYAHQTDIAKEQCKGDWLFYLQSDEVIHEKYLPIIKSKCTQYLHDEEVEGFLFDYRHFWGDYDHYIVSHKWYPKEIRIIRNKPDIHSWKDAQSFRKIPGFKPFDYQRKENTFKLKVVNASAEVFHYGWVRPPQLMDRKDKIFQSHYRDTTSDPAYSAFHYGDLSKLRVFKGTHPATMHERMKLFNWQEALDLKYDTPNRKQHPHEKRKARILTSIEQRLLGGRQLGGFKNYELLDR
ncbi:MAG: glycosyltransferase family 2 protein [Chitinophagaceae bacterium]